MSVERLLETINRTPASGEKAGVSGFGKFNQNQKKQRKGRNSAAGDAMMLDAKKVEE